MNAPKLRFREFTDEWKACKLDDITEMIKDGTHGSFRDYSGGIPLLSAKDIRENEIFPDDNPRRISQKDFNTIHKTYNLKNGDVLLTIVGSLGRSAIVHDYKNNYTLQRSVAILRMNSSSDPEFVLQTFQTKKFQRELKLRENKAIQSGIYLGELAKVPIVLPSLPEQQKIAKFLSAVDARIDAASRKLELLRDYKTAVSRKIFSREIRFPGFSDEWKLQKLGEISDISTGGKDLQNKVDGGKYPFFVRSQNIERINSYSYDGEAILVPGEGNIGKIFHYINGKFDYHQRVYKVSDFAKHASGKYIYYYFCENFERQAMANSVKATVDSLRLPTFKEFDILLPTLPEQKKIANFLSGLDLKISTENAILTDMKGFKKALLKEILV